MAFLPLSRSTHGPQALAGMYQAEEVQKNKFKI